MVASQSCVASPRPYLAPCHNLVPWHGPCELELPSQSWVQSQVQSLEELECGLELELEEVLEKKPQVAMVPVPRRCSDQQRWKELTVWPVALPF